MYLCCVEILSGLQSKLDLKKILELLKNWAKDPVLQYSVFDQKWIGKNSPFL